MGIDWNDGGASLQDDDHTEIEPNMTFHLIVGIWEKGDGNVFNETVRIDSSGATSLSCLSRDLLVNY
ncbi:hypothetical protein P0R27_37535 [Bradyrhizobium yuanmingense]|nr:hypothetical protein [Bradyrhizobium yuanmingense]MDF0498974.1 hypothetical protein [Bradyrhizobium yuanmingense]